MKIELPTEFVKMPRFAPAISAGVLSFLLLLFLRELSDKIRMFLLPSLILYAQSTAFVGMIHRLLGLHYEVPPERIEEGGKVTFKFISSEKTIPLVWKIIIYFVHLVLLVFLLAYNFWRCVL